ncbi:MAG: HAD-IIIC family phosphatase [Polyangiales bacterium]
MSDTDLRAQAEEAVREGRLGEARVAFAELLAAKPSAATAAVILRQREFLAPVGSPARLEAEDGEDPRPEDSEERVGAANASRTSRPLRAAFLRSFTVEPVVPLLEAYAACHGLALETWVGDFNAYVQELLDPASSLYAFAPDVVFLTVLADDLVPALTREFASQTEDTIAAAADEALATFGTCVRALRTHSVAPLVVQNLEAPSSPAHGLWDAQAACSQREALQHLNQRLRQLCREVPGAYTLDYDALVAQHGAATWRDQQRWAAARMPLSRQALLPLAKTYARYALAVAGRTKKVLVLDLDDTLWGGILGEVGVEGLQVGDDPRGAPYRELQRAALELRDRGVLLAISSKNDHEDALNAMRTLPGMLLREEHFAAMRIGWQDKAQSCREIAAELNVGVDSLVFLDDNPAERARVRHELPEVHVPELTDPASYAARLRDVPLFERLSLTEEDRQRSRFYAQRREASALAEVSADLPSYYRSLAMRAHFAGVSSLTLPRVAQLTQKTNQFNLTTRRYTEADITRLARDGGVYTMSVTDRFGDQGLVGVAITLPVTKGWELDTFLMSCRVIGRTLETAFLAFVADRARASGCEVLRGTVLPTAKNAPARDVYARHGFTPVEADGADQGALCYDLDLTQPGPEAPPWVQCHVAEDTP